MKVHRVTDTSRQHRSMRMRSLPLSIAAAMLLIGAVPAAGATEIERVWSFNGGEVAVSTLSGKLVGVVVTPTKFSECIHKAGEEMWTGMTLQPDGSYWGLHQWLYQESCAPNPVPGPTAWRVLQKSNGSRYLLVCFSNPGDTQPTIASSGATASWTFGCVESSPTAPLPVVANSDSGQSGAEQISFRKVVGLPKASMCVRRHSLKLKLHDPKRDPLKEVTVRIGSRKVVDVRGVARLRRGIVLKGLPSGTYTIKIVATTVLDQRLTGRRTYRGCGQGAVPLHHRKPHRHG